MELIINLIELLQRLGDEFPNYSFNIRPGWDLEKVDSIIIQLNWPRGSHMERKFTFIMLQRSKSPIDIIIDRLKADSQRIDDGES